MEQIKIFKGNDTNFNDGKFLTFTVTGDIDLSDFSGIFTLGSFSKPGSLADGKMEVVIPAAVTAQFPLGPMCGTFQLVDSKMRVATVTNTIPFLITNEVFTPTPDVVELETPEGYPVNVNMQIGFASGNYNDLNNLPQINGVTLTGNKTTEDLGLVGAEELQAVQDELTAHVNNQSNPHLVTKSQVGLSNVDNTADLDKPVSTATQTALNSKQDALTSTQLQAVNSGITTAGVAQIGTNTSGISDINAKIPTQASASNQLADKNFVNSSIATNTANFIGTFTSVEDLEAYSATLTNNDYAFVETTDQAGNTLYKRYKYNGTAWVFEYELNNSSFTAAQFAALNSGITAQGVAQIGTNETAITGLQNTKLDSATAASTYATQTALVQELATKQDVISDLATIRSGALAGATALQPATAAATYVANTQKGVANGVASLDANGQIAAGQINYATSARVGGIKQSFDGTTGTWTVTVEEV